MSILTCVSGYWQVTNKHTNNYLQWFNNSLKVNCPYVFFQINKVLKLLKNIELDCQLTM
jgi:hypothetical protein